MTTRVTGQAVGRRIWLGYLAALGAAMSYGTVAVVARKIVTEFAPPVVGTAFSLMFGMIIIAVIFRRQAIEDYARRPPRRGWLYVALAGLAATWGVGFWFMALSEAPVVLVVPVTSTFPLMAIVMTQVFLRRLERVTPRTIIGALLVLLGVTLIVLGRS